jgi:hypothetical protein
LVRNLGKRAHLKDLGIDGRTILKRIFKKQDVGVDWTAVDQNRDK